MSSVRNSNQPNVNKQNDDTFPVAAIVCLSCGGYIILVIIFLMIRRMLVKKGYCLSDCCSSESGTCCFYCAKLNEACPCCCNFSAEACLSAVCGQRKKIYCVDILICNCCGCTEGCCENCFQKYGKQTSSIPTSGIIP